MLMQLATLAGALFVGLAAIALVYLLGMRAKSPLVLRPPHPAPARDHQPPPDAIGGHARSVRVRDPASRPGLRPTVRDARRGGGHRRRVRDRARVRVAHELAARTCWRAGPRPSSTRGRPTRSISPRSSRCRRLRRSSRPAISEASVGSPSIRRSGFGGSSRERPRAPVPEAPEGEGAQGLSQSTRPGRWRPSMSHDPRTVVRDFRPEDRAAAIAGAGLVIPGLRPAGPGGRR